MPIAQVLAATVFEAATSSTGKPSAGSSVASLLFLVVLVGLAYMFFLRPRANAARRQRSTLMDLSAGDEVLTGSGIFGRVLDVEPDRVTIETAPGTRITVVRSTIARRLTEPAPDESTWHDEEREGVGAHEPSHEQRSGHDGHQDDDHQDGDHEDDDHEDEVSEPGSAHDAGEPEPHDGTATPDATPEDDTP